ncbi:IclR family transcriptional regulator [Streptomyces sp. 110]|uniref:IclR family transcriptional regulator n=1 Tax=Streptomyces endocoffeicus TaxID=2898945 RepID=A0ABS1Q3U9_9ACTN|nr:IclR family transcriptional regulator [Streptomyces endocoffeicus]MBL1118631.1 IclR family transcriptional regulator [Streptomyces endocoffeicus]
MSDRVQAVERALLLLEEVAASPVPPTAPEIAQRAGVNRATAWRLLSTLEHFDLVERDPLSGRYTIAYGTVRLARATDESLLIRRARPALERLAARTDGSAFLEVATRGTLVVLDEARPASPVHVDLAGIDVPLHCGSAGKLYLASLPEQELADRLAAPLARPTPYTITNPSALRDEIDACRRTGVAVNYKEHQEEWCGITAAVRDRAGRDLAYVNLTLPTYRWTDPELRALAPLLKEAAGEIEDRLYVSRRSGTE